METTVVYCKRLNPRPPFALKPASNVASCFHRSHGDQSSNNGHDGTSRTHQNDCKETIPLVISESSVISLQQTNLHGTS